MPGSTPKHALPYSLGSDSSQTIDDTMAALALAVDNKLNIDSFMRAESYKAQSIPAGSWYNIDFWSPSYVHADITMSGGPEARTTFTINRAGLYDLRFTAMFRNDVSSAGVRATGIWLNNATQLAGYYAPPLAAQADYASSSCDTLYRLAVNDFIQFRVLQNTASAVNVHNAPWTQCSIRRVAN